jgi:hypothetical protein
MAINYVIQAGVVDINADSPTPTDVFFVDTNVWYWMTYPNAATAAYPGQLSDYPAFVNRALAVGAKLCCSGLSLAELSHLIEKTEREIYEKSVGIIRAKEYRHNLPIERSRVVSEVEASWGQVKSLSSPLALTVDEKATDAGIRMFTANRNVLLAARTQGKLMPRISNAP